MELREAGGLTGAVFSSDDVEAVRQWVQDRSSYPEIIATPARLYLPVGSNGMAQVNPGDVIWWDPESGMPNPFAIERFL